MRYLSVCSGIEAATVAWHPLGWEPAAFAEIEAFPSAVLAHHYPDVPNLGDITKLSAVDLEVCKDVGLLVGGTPCQAWSVAGKRRGMEDPRAQVARSFIDIAAHLRPGWVLWENVPGVLTKNGGWDFAQIVRGLVDCGYGVAWRVLDARFFGVPQRRRRLFLVGCLGDVRRAGAVLFECPCSGGNPSSGRPAKAEGPAQNTDGVGDYCGTLTTNRTPSADSACAGQLVVYGGGSTKPRVEAPTLTATKSARYDLSVEASVLEAQQDAVDVRRLTPLECERLQGFPDQYTRISWRKKAPEGCPDGHRYRALGNSMAVPVMRWLGRRIDAA